MRICVLVVLSLFSLISHAEQYTCTYTGYLNNEPVLLKIHIDGAKAYVGDEEYEVVENTRIGVVLVRSFAFHSDNRQRDEVGLFGLVINKSTLAMTRGNIIQGDADGAVRHGLCIR